MSHDKKVDYVLQNYDHVLIIASWGMPREYKTSRYILEVEESKNSRIRRTTVGRKDSYNSSTTAIRDILSKKIGMSNKIGLLIFCQDTILIDYLKELIMKNSKNTSTSCKGFKFKRCELKDKLLSELFNQNEKIARELNVRDCKDYEKLVRFVPGVITSVEYSYLYTWRGEHSYDLLLGGITLYTYKKLKELSRDAKKIAVLVDTTHGINYFVTALMEGVLIAAALYALDRLVNSCGSSDNNTLHELTVYHYNSDPLLSDSVGNPSLKVHLLNKINVVKDKEVLLDNIFATINEKVSREGIDMLSDWLNMNWEGVEWRRVIGSLLLISKGLLVWALRIASDIDNVPSIDDLENSLEEIKVEISSDKIKDKIEIIKYNIDYRPTNRMPITEVIEYTILVNTLRSLSDKTACTNNACGKSFEVIERVSKELNDLQANVNSYIENLKSNIHEIVEAKDKYVCYDLEKLIKFADLMYTSPYRDIIINEIKNIKDYLTETPTTWNKVNDHIYLEPRINAAYLIKYSDMRILMSVKKRGIDKRNTYAHAGLAYGLPWFALHLEKERKDGIKILCIGEPTKILDMLNNIYK